MFSDGLTEQREMRKGEKKQEAMLVHRIWWRHYEAALLWLHHRKNHVPAAAQAENGAMTLKSSTPMACHLSFLIAPESCQYPLHIADTADHEMPLVDISKRWRARSEI